MKALQEVRGKNPPVTASPCQPPLGKGAMGTGVRIATASVRTGLAMTLVFHGGAVCGGAHGPRPTKAFARIAGGQGRSPLCKARRCEQARTGGVEPRPYGSVTRSVTSTGRADVGSELSAAGGRGSEVSEWPRSKFPASAVRQRRNFGHRNRVIRNTPAQRSRRTDCHSQCAHRLRNDTVNKRCGANPGGWTEASTSTEVF